MNYYTERNGLRAEKSKTYKISIEAYRHLFKKCEEYFDNIAWKFPRHCPDTDECCGLDIVELSSYMNLEVPALYKNKSYIIDVPRITKNVFEEEPEEDEYDQFALLDFLEFMHNNIKDVKKIPHKYFHHNDLKFTTTTAIQKDNFREDINDLFDKLGLLYKFNDSGMIERMVEYDILTEEVERDIDTVDEDGLKDLLNKAILLFRSPDLNARQDGLEKIWDAFERLKTYYTGSTKKKSVGRIVSDMSTGKKEFEEIFNNEFKELTKIGNDFRIRHHETDKIDIVDDRHYDYFFNRCMSLISVSLRFLENNNEELDNKQ